jgi:outer membrane protein assembly factor BamB
MSPLSGSWSRRWWLAIVGVALLATAAQGQVANPVYPDDSAVARETLMRISEFLAAGNDAEAVRELQRLLDQHGERVVQGGVGVPGQTDLYTSVRQRAQEALLQNPHILERYRAAESTRAQQLLDAGAAEQVERTRLLTAPGFEAALRVAQMRLESASFEAARLVLEQLEHHPDRIRGTAAAADAAALFAEVARYLNRPEVWESARRWSREAGTQEPAPAAAAVPAIHTQRIASFAHVSPPVEAEGLPAKPLWSVPIALEEAGEPGRPVPPPSLALAPEDPTITLSRLWVLPTVVGDTVYINDATSITARDRFTLQPRWTVRPISEFATENPYTARPPHAYAPLEDTSTVTISGRLLVATMGAAQNGDREGEPGTYALDAITGQILWSAQMPLLDPQLDGASVRGPAMIDGDTVVLLARKNAQGRRMITSYLVGLNSADGKLRYLRPLASAGALIWGVRSDQRHSSAMLHQGIVYCVDNIGVVAAIEARSGRPVWVRRVMVTSIMPGMGTDLVFPWQTAPPLVHNGSMFLLAPDRSGMLQLDTQSGAIRSRRTASSLGTPLYLLRVGEHFAAVGREAIVIGPLADIAEGQVHRTRPFSPTIRGRVALAGHSLLVPTHEGVSVIDPAEPTKVAAAIKLEQLGNILPLESQLLAIDGVNIYSYLTWGVAHGLLDQRMRESPSDPEPAITYAELAYRAGHHDRIADAADRALAAIEQVPGADTARAARRRLFTVLKEMVDWSQQAWEAQAGERPFTPQPPHVAPQTEVDASQRGQPRIPVRRPEPERPRLGLADMGAVLVRMARAAQSSDDHVSHLVALGRLREAENKPALAAEAYQRILADNAMSRASWRTAKEGGQASVRGEVEATRRIRQLLLDHGPGSYAAFELQAQDELAALGPQARLQDLERLARRYPASTAAAEAWVRIAELHEQGGGGQQLRPAIAALREGLAAAETTFAAGAAANSEMLGEHAGRLVARLQRAEQYFAAAQTIARLQSRYPELVFQEKGTPLQIGELASVLSQRLAAADRLPRIGSSIQPQAQAIERWSLMAPRMRDRTGVASEHVMMASASEGRVGLWSAAMPRAGGEAPLGGARLQLLWSRPFEQTPPTLLRQDPEAIYLFWPRSPNGQGPTVERISAVDGSTVYRTEPFRSLFAADPQLQRRTELLRNTIETPLDGTVRLSDCLTVMDADVVVLAERTGRIAAFERDTGKLLWAEKAAASQVYDVAIAGGVLAIGGDGGPDNDPHAIAARGGGLLPVISLHEAKTGKLLHRVRDLKGQVRWLRMGLGPNQQPALIAGLLSEIVSIDVQDATISWTIVGGPAFGSLEAWAMGDRLFVLDQQRELWMLDAAGGKAPIETLQTHDRLSGVAPIEGMRLSAAGEDRYAFATERGVCIFDRAGNLVGLDSLSDETGEAMLLSPVAAQRGGEGEQGRGGVFITMDAAPKQVSGKGVVYTLFILDSASGALKASRHIQLDMPPKRLAVLDGRILITAGNITLCYEASD